ncbi:MAG: zinc ribbon domain-containing protein [Candidatus Pacearchaeota archaeon]|jgi:HSP20 family molecular chaperone IbpA
MVKKKCPRCNEKVKSSYDFCPSCGLKLNENSKKYGMLGKNDFLDDTENPFFSSASGLGGFNPGFLGSMINRTMKMLEKEMAKEFEKNISESKKINKTPSENTRIRLMINGKDVTPLLNSTEKKISSPIKTLPINFSDENLRKFKTLKKKEPKTQIRRIGDKLTYELDVPGVKSINDVSITNLEEGLEIKAIAKDKAYQKSISINFPLTKYILSNGKLSLEMDPNAE